MRRTILLLAVAGALVLACSGVVLAQQAKPAQAQTSGDTECVGGTASPLTGTFENVVVPEGEQCALSDSQVSGDVTVLENASLNASTNTIGGNVLGDKPSTIRLAANKVGGNVQANGAGLLRLTNTLGGTAANSPNTVGGSILATKGGNFLSCGTILPTGSIQVQSQTSENVHIGGGLCIDTPGFGGSNRLDGGGIQVAQNKFTNPSETLGLNVSNNQVAQDLQVIKNTGVGQKRVQNNTVGANLQCEKNHRPFIGQPNVVGGNAGGQCAPS
jgi:hypothetical protein